MSTRASATTASAGSAVRAAVTVIAGFHRHASHPIADRFLADDPSLVLVDYDLTGLTAGRVRRTVRNGTGLREDVQVNLEHGCVSCTIREDVLPTLVRLGRADPSRGIVLLLPAVVEPSTVAGACASCLVDGESVSHWLRFDSYLTVVDSATLLPDLDSTDGLADRGIQAAENDNRGVAEVVAGQIEFADTVLLWEDADLDSTERLRNRVLVHRLAPWAAHHCLSGAAGFDSLALRRTPRHHPEVPEPVARGLEGYSLGQHQPAGDWGVSSTVFHGRRPMHPQRLHRMLVQIASKVLRARGHAWLATRPALALGLESAGASVSIGSLGRWLASIDPADHDELPQLRRLAAAVDWDPYYGDRSNQLALIAVDTDPDALQDALAACQLNDAELALGEQLWSQFPDPFAEFFPSDDDIPDEERS